jgi:hypothetical protein
MKIPLDFFLRLIEKFLSEQEFDKVIKKLKKHFETPEEDFSDILSDLSLQDIISKYVKENKELKKKLKAKSKKFLEESKANEEEEEKEEKKIINKKRKRTMSNTKDEEKEEKEEKKNKKRKRTMSSTKDEKDNEEEKEEKKPKRKRTMSSTKDDKEKEEKKEKKEKSAKKQKKQEDKEDESEKEEEKETKKNKKKKKKADEEDIDLEKEVQFIPKPKSDNNPNRVPFKRIDDSHIKYQVPEKLRDNSYAAFMKQTGDDFGKAANDKLIVTRGKGFRKEKTKFKNKTFHGGNTISTTVRSIPLEDDSSSDEQ